MKSHFHMNSCAPSLALKKMKKFGNGLLDYELEISMR